MKHLLTGALTLLASTFKKTFNFFGMMHLIVGIMLVFSFIACDDGNGGGGDPDLAGNITISPSAGVTTGTELTANYSGTETVTYQWKRGTTDLGTAQTQVADQAGSYTVTVNAAGFKSKTSSAVNVTTNGGAGGGDPAIVTATGEVWVSDVDSALGFIAQSGIMYDVIKTGGSNWSNEGQIGTYDENNISYDNYGSVWTVTYTVTSNVLEIKTEMMGSVMGTETYTKVTGQTIN